MDIIEIIFANAEKLTIEVVAFGLIVLGIYGTRTFFRFMGKQSEGDSKLTDLAASALKTTGQINDAVQSMGQFAKEQSEATRSLNRWLESVNTTLQNLPEAVAQRVTSTVGLQADTLVSRFEHSRLLQLKRGVIVVNSAGIVISVNNDALELLSADQSRVMGRNINSAFANVVQYDLTPVSDADRPHQHALEGMKVKNQLLGYYAPHSTKPLWFLVDAEPIQTSRTGTRAIITFRDIGDLISLHVRDTREFIPVDGTS